MLFYFSGTGNSLYAAQKLAELLDELSRDEMRHSRMVMHLLECIL